MYLEMVLIKCILLANKFDVFSTYETDNSSILTADEAIATKFPKLPTAQEKRQFENFPFQHEDQYGDRRAATNDLCSTYAGHPAKCESISRCYQFKYLNYQYSSNERNFNNLCPIYNEDGNLQEYGICCDRLANNEPPPAFSWQQPPPFHPPYTTTEPSSPPHTFTSKPKYTYTRPTYTFTRPTFTVTRPTYTFTHPSHTFTHPSHTTFHSTSMEPPSTIQIGPSYDPSECGILTNDEDQVKIVGGENTSKGEWPWMAAIMIHNKLHCGGSLIDEEYILTAAHCVAHMTSWDVANLKVYLGDYNIHNSTDINHVERKVKKVIRHRWFDAETLYHDVALLKMDKFVKFSSKIRPVCLPRKPLKDYFGRTATVIGWGSIEEKGPFPPFLQKTNITIWSNENCQLKYGPVAPGGIIDTFLCAGSDKRDSCSGDSGGPLLVYEGRWIQVGIVSWGIGCGKGKYPGVYTRVTSYVTWIRKNMDVRA